MVDLPHLEGADDVLKPAVEAQRKPIIFFSNGSACALFGAYRFEQDRAVGNRRSLAQCRLERHFLAITANPEHFYPDLSGPNALHANRATAVFHDFDRHDHRAVDIGALAQGHIAGVGERRELSAGRARNQRERQCKNGEMKGCFLHLRDLEAAAMNPP